MRSAGTPQEETGCKNLTFLVPLRSVQKEREPRMTPVGGRPYLYLTRYSLGRQALVAIRQMAVGTVAQTRPPM